MDLIQRVRIAVIAASLVIAVSAAVFGVAPGYVIAWWAAYKLPAIMLPIVASYYTLFTALAFAAKEEKSRTIAFTGVYAVLLPLTASILKLLVSDYHYLRTTMALLALLLALLYPASLLMAGKLFGYSTVHSLFSAAQMTVFTLYGIKQLVFGATTPVDYTLTRILTPTSFSLLAATIAHAAVNSMRIVQQVQQTIPPTTTAQPPPTQQTTTVASTQPAIQQQYTLASTIASSQQATSPQLKLVEYKVKWGRIASNIVDIFGRYRLSELNKICLEEVKKEDKKGEEDNDEKAIGTGGEGIVYKVYNCNTKKPIVIIYSDIFRREAATAVEDIPVRLCAKKLRKDKEEEKEEEEKRLAEKLEKLKVMIESENPPGNINNAMVAWPLGIIYDKEGKFVGYIMPQIEGAIELAYILAMYKHKSERTYDVDLEWISKLRKKLEEYLRVLEELENSASTAVAGRGLDAIRRRIKRVRNSIKFLSGIEELASLAKGGDEKSRMLFEDYVDFIKLRIARNIACLVKHLHEKGYVIGDINPNNFLVTLDGDIALIDVDSIAMPRPGGGYIPTSGVGVPKYQAPEVLKADAKGENGGTKLVHDEYTDRFSLAILLFEILMDGFNPFYGTPKDTSEHSGRITEADNIKRCLVWIFDKDKVRVPSTAPEPERLDELSAGTGIRLIEMFRRALKDGCRRREVRPSASEWCSALTIIADKKKKKND